MQLSDAASSIVKSAGSAAPEDATSMKEGHHVQVHVCGLQLHAGCYGCSSDKDSLQCVWHSLLGSCGGTVRPVSHVSEKSVLVALCSSLRVLVCNIAIAVVKQPHQRWQGQLSCQYKQCCQPLFIKVCIHHEQLHPSADNIHGVLLKRACAAGQTTSKLNAEPIWGDMRANTRREEH